MDIADLIPSVITVASVVISVGVVGVRGREDRSVETTEL